MNVFAPLGLYVKIRILLWQYAHCDAQKQRAIR